MIVPSDFLPAFAFFGLLRSLEEGGWQVPTFSHTLRLKFEAELSWRFLQRRVYPPSVVVVKIATNGFSEIRDGLVARGFAELQLEGSKEGFLSAVVPWLSHGRM